MIPRKIKRLIRKTQWKCQIKRKFRKNKSEIGRIIFCRNPQYITIDGNVRIKEFSRIECFDKWNGKKLTPVFHIGKNVIIQDFFTAFVTCELSIGDYCIFAKNVTIVTENHGTNPESTDPYYIQDLKSENIIIGNNCWIGVNVIILPGTIIGDNCVIAANSVVKGNYPNNSMIGGIPSRILRSYSFDDHKWMK